MGSDHSHSHAHLTASGRHRWRLAVSFGLVGAFFVVELVAALASGSLALLSDAGHMAADVVTLAAALIATRLATRPDVTGRRTFGHYRAEVFASGLAVLMMLGVAAYTALEAVARIGRPPSVASGTMLAVGALGLAVNVVTMLLLRDGAAESLNVRGAYLEVVADAVGSVGVMVAGALIAWTGNGWWDTVVALAIAVFVAVRAVRLGREVLSVLGQHAPAGVEPTDIVTALSGVHAVVEVHDLHVWTLTSGMDVATAHLVRSPTGDADAVLADASAVLREQFGIAHATLQVETVDGLCTSTGW